jgi:hypothetical protein
MKSAIWLVGVVRLCSFFCPVSQAQEFPEWEISGGYSYLAADVNGSSFHLHGGVASLTQNVNSIFGGRVEAGFFTGAAFGRSITAQTITFGPLFSLRKFEKFTPFVHLQLGAVHGSKGYLGISESAWKFALVGGGGADIRINERAAIRLQADYLMTRFLGLRQNNLQASAGLVLRFGKKTN